MYVCVCGGAGLVLATTKAGQIHAQIRRLRDRRLQGSF